MSRQQPSYRQAPIAPGRLAAIETTLRDLADNQRRLQEQIREILDRLEYPRDGAAPGASARRSASRRPASGLFRDPSAALWKRVLRRVLRSTLGVARGLWRVSDPAAGRELRIELAATPASTRPRVGDDYVVAEGGAALSSLSTARRELAELTLASEGLAFLEIPAGAGSGTAPGDSVLLVERALAKPGGGMDLAAFKGRRWQRSRPPKLGKVLGGRSLRDYGLRAVGEYRIADRHLPYRHCVKPLDGQGRDRSESAAGDPALPAVLLLLGSPLAGGLEQAVAGVVRELGEAFRFLVVSLAASDDLQGERFRELERLAPLYPLADFLPAPVLPSTVRHLAVRHRAAAVVHLGGGEPPSEVVDGLAALDPAPKLVDRPPICGVADGEGGGRPSRRGTRETLGVAADQLLVVMAADLLPRKRPEDFVALAHRLRADRRFVFVLAGRGPCAGTVGDLERYLAPANFRRLEAPVPADLLAAADIVCTTSEEELYPCFVLAALAAGLPVVAAAVGGLPEVLAEGPCGIAVPFGDLPAFESAILKLADGSERRRLGQNGRRLVERRFRLDDICGRFEKGLREALGHSGRR